MTTAPLTPKIAQYELPSDTQAIVARSRSVLDRRLSRGETATAIRSYVAIGLADLNLCADRIVRGSRDCDLTSFISIVRILRGGLAELFEVADKIERGWNSGDHVVLFEDVSNETVFAIRRDGKQSPHYKIKSSSLHDVWRCFNEEPCTVEAWSREYSFDCGRQKYDRELLPDDREAFLKAHPLPAEFFEGGAE